MNSTNLDLALAIKTLYGVIPYSGTAALAIIWLGIAAASLREPGQVARWLSLLFAGAGYGVMFLMLAIIASGNEMLGLQANAWINRTAAWCGFTFLTISTYLYLVHKWRRRSE